MGWLWPPCRRDPARQTDRRRSGVGATKGVIGSGTGVGAAKRVAVGCSTRILPTKGIIARATGILPAKRIVVGCSTRILSTKGIISTTGWILATKRIVIAACGILPTEGVITATRWVLSTEGIAIRRRRSGRRIGLGRAGGQSLLKLCEITLGKRGIRPQLRRIAGPDRLSDPHKPGVEVGSNAHRQCDQQKAQNTNSDWPESRSNGPDGPP